MRRKRAHFPRYSIAVLAVAGATLLRYLSNPLLGFRSPFLFHVLAIAVAAQFRGIAEGLIATALSVGAIDLLFMEPVGSLILANSADLMPLLLFTLVGVALSLFAGRRKRAEDEVARIRYNLETAQHLASIGSWESDLVGKLWWSPETYNIFGVPPGSINNTEDFYNLVHPEDRQRVREAVTRAVEAKSDYDVEHCIVRRSDGEVRQVHQRAKLIFGRGSGVHMIGSIKDITGLKRGEMAEKILGGLFQVCSACRRIQNRENGEWYSMEGYLRLHGSAEFSHGMCPDCGRQWYPPTESKS
jgi:PAS domain S-box-containing protein